MWVRKDKVKRKDTRVRNRKEYSKAYYLKTKEVQKQYRERTKEKRKLAQKKYYQANKARIKKVKQAYLAKTKELRKLKSAKYYEIHKDECIARAEARYASKLRAIPKWVDSEQMWLIGEIYHLAQLRNATTGTRWAVDHIVPLKGERVSGLHVPQNLQVIPEQLNRIKYNTFEVA